MLLQRSRQEMLEVVFSYVEKSFFYKKKYSEITIKKFIDIPFLSKTEILQDQNFFPPYGTNLCCPEEDIVRVHRTSGTTNAPLLIALTKSDLDIVVDIGSNLFKRIGIDKKSTIVNCLSYNMWMGGYTDHQSLEKTGATVIPFGVGHTDSLISLLQNFKGASLHCTPSYLKVIKEKLSSVGLCPKDLNLSNGFFGAEGGLQNKEFRNKIEDEWGIDAYNANYGISEVISIMGAECEMKNGLHFGATEALYIELVDEYLIPVKISSGVKGELVITHLRKEAQPLIRYRTGDIIQISSIGDCSCGFSGITFSVAGRVDDMLVIKGVNFFPESIRGILSQYIELSGLYKIIISNDDTVESIKILVERGNDVFNEDILRDSLLHEIKSRLNISVGLEFTYKIEYLGNKMKIVEWV